MRPRFRESGVGKLGRKQDFTEAMAVYHAAAELSRQEGIVSIVLAANNKGFDLHASKGVRKPRVEVKGLKSGGVFWFNGDDWYDAAKTVEADVVIGVRAIGKNP